MRKLLELWRRILFLRRRGRFDRELEEEMRFHLEMKIEDNVARGMGPEEARRAAVRQFGNSTSLREASKEMWGFNNVEVLIRDLRYGLRTLRRKPGFALVSVLTLALGVGAATSIFSVVNAVLLRPLPFPEAERLVQVWENNLKRGWTRDTVSPLNFEDWRAHGRAFEAVSAYGYESFVLGGGQEPERLGGVLASSDFFRVLGVNPALGRSFLAGEDKRGGGRVVVISHALWERRFGSRADPLDQVLVLNGQPHTVVGVMPRGFRFPHRTTDVWVASIDTARPRSDHFMYAVARLKSGTTIEAAQADIDRVARSLSQQYPDTNENSGVTLVPLQEEIVGKVRRPLILLLGATGLLLLVACANVANLLLARASGRQREIAVRAALGAGRARIARQLLTESLLLSALGGAGGLLLSAWGVRALVSASAGSIPRAQEIGLDPAAFAFALAASALTGLLFGLAPALNLSAPDFNQALKEGGKGSGAARGRGQSRVQGALVVSEIALALVLLAGAGLLVKSYSRLSRVDPGFDAGGVLTARVSLSESKYKEKDRQALFFRQVLERLRAQPGVAQAGAVSDLPFSGSRTSQSFDVDGRPTGAHEVTPSADYRKISPGYFGAMGIPVLRGRDFTERDTRDSQPVAVVNEALARRFFGGEDAVGRRLVYREGGGEVAREIVGVVADLVHDDLAGERAPEVYVPFTQRPNPWMFLAVRGAGDPSALAGAVRAAAREVDPGEPVYSVLSMRQRLDQWLAPQRFNTLLLVAFAATATLLAAVGVFGVMSFQVAERTHEIGVRMALGARPRDVIRLVVGRAMALTLVGVALGLAGALALTRLMVGLLYGTSALDPATFVCVALLLSAVALAACLIPALRAARVDPTTALRAE